MRRHKRCDYELFRQLVLGVYLIVQTDPYLIVSPLFRTILCESRLVEG